MSIITISSIFENDFDNFCEFCGNTCVNFLIDTTGYEDGLTEYIFRPIWFRYVETPIKFSNDEKGKEAFLRNFCNQLNEVVFDFYTYCKENIDYIMYQTNPLNEGKPMSKNITTGISPINQNIDQTVDSTSLASGTGSQYISETVYNGVAWHKLVDAYFTPNRKTALLKAFQWLFVSVYSPETKYDDKIEEKRYVELSFVDDDNNIIDEQIVYPTKSYFTMSEVDIARPENLEPQNIVKDVEIAGIIGTYDKPILDYLNYGEAILNENMDIKAEDYDVDGIKEIVIIPPATALPENIKKDVNIGGIIGTFIGGIDLLGNRINNNNGATPYTYENNTVTNMLKYCFYYDSNITSFSSTSVTEIGEYGFYYATNLTAVDCPSLAWQQGSNAPSYVFANCSNLTTVNLPSIKRIGGYCFNACVKLKNVSFPQLTTSIAYSVFNGCTLLETVDLGNLDTILRNWFTNCTSLISITLRKSDNICSLTNTNAFDNIGHAVTVYVPSNLITTYQTATNWSTLYNNGNVTFVAL